MNRFDSKDVVGSYGPEQQIFCTELAAAAARARDTAAVRLAEAKELKALSRKLLELPRLLGSPPKAKSAMLELRRGARAEIFDAAYATDLFQRLDAFVAKVPEQARDRFSRELAAECAKRGLEFKVISTRPVVEIRIPPLSVVVDFESGSAEIQFARERITECAATIGAVLKARDDAMAALEKDFDVERFFETIRWAYRSTLLRSNKSEGERVELREVLPLIGFELQPKKKRRGKSSEGASDYVRAQLAYGVMKLQEARVLVQKGHRLNFGVATGMSASDRSRVIYFEDRNGSGENKLSLYFTAEGEGQC